MKKQILKKIISLVLILATLLVSAGSTYASDMPVYYNEKQVRAYADDDASFYKLCMQGFGTEAWYQFFNSSVWRLTGYWTEYDTREWSTRVAMENAGVLPVAGDIIVFTDGEYFAGDTYGGVCSTTHVAIVASDVNAYGDYYTIDGNTGEYGVVGLNKRNINETYLNHTFIDSDSDTFKGQYKIYAIIHSIDGNVRRQIIRTAFYEKTRYDTNPYDYVAGIHYDMNYWGNWCSGYVDRVCLESTPAWFVLENNNDYENMLIDLNPDVDDVEEKLIVNTGENGNLVIFGNSWSEGWGAGLYYPDVESEYEIIKQGRYTRYLASALGMTEYNYALGGAGFVVDNVISWMPENNNYMRQYNQAMASMSEEQRNNTKIVFIMGGWNDGEHAEYLTYDTMLAKVDEVVSASITSFPNATIILAISQSSCDSVFTYSGPSDWRTWMENICTEIENRHPDEDANVVCMPEVMDMPGQNTTYYLADGIHPNLLGHKELACQILEWMVDKNVISEYNDSEVTATFSFQGDVNGDGVLDPRDYVRVKNCILGKKTITTSYVSYLADANNDGTIDPRDYVRIKNRILGR